MNRCVVVGGAPIENYEYIRSFLKNDDYFIFCDCGLRHAEKLRVIPDLIVGDFDSSVRPLTNAETIVLPKEKDDTDSFYAVKEAVSRGYDDFLLAGFIGRRFDHTLGNLSILVWLHDMGKTATLIDDYSEIELISDRTTIDDSYQYFSVINLTGEGQDISILNAKYPLEHDEIGWNFQYGISNEVISGKKAEVMVGKGTVLIIKTAKKK